MLDNKSMVFTFVSLTKDSSRVISFINSSMTSGSPSYVSYVGSSDIANGSTTTYLENLYLM